MTAFLINLAVSAVVVLLLVGGTYLLAVRRDVHSLIDVTWGFAFAAVAAVSYLLSIGDGDGTRRLVALALTVIWGLRITWHLGRRARGAPEDARYTELLKDPPGGDRNRYSIRKVYLPQGLSILLISLPVQVAMYIDEAPGFFLAAGVLVWAAGFAFEAIGDHQLAAFRADPANKGKVMDRGLFRYTRHPNYFGDALLWWGLFLLACDAPVGWLTVVSPLAMTYFITAVTGQRLADERMARTKPGYTEYMARTSAFIPRRPRL